VYVAGIDISLLSGKGSGPNGRIIAADVSKLASSPATPASASAFASAPPATASADYVDVSGINYVLRLGTVSVSYDYRGNFNSVSYNNYCNSNTSSLHLIMCDNIMFVPFSVTSLCFYKSLICRLYS